MKLIPLKAAHRFMSLRALVVAFFALQLLGSNCLADPLTITGAFGLKLGDIYAPPTSDNDYIYSPAFVIFNVIPPEPNPLFETYSLVVSAKTHQACEIIAKTKPAPLEQNNLTSGKLIDVLQAKYGPPIDAHSRSDARYKSGDRWLTVHTNIVLGRMPPVFVTEISYSDKALSQKITADFTAESAAKSAVTDKGL